MFFALAWDSELCRHGCEGEYDAKRWMFTLYASFVILDNIAS
jgi:hypothetical protein